MILSTEQVVQDECSGWGHQEETVQVSEKESIELDSSIRRQQGNGMIIYQSVQKAPFSNGADGLYNYNRRFDLMTFLD